MSFIVRSRLQKFRQHKLGWASFVLFSLILMMSLAAELIANDKPLLVKYEDAYYLPVFKTYPETTFGGVFETEADYKDPAVQELINPVPSPPSKQNWLGTDDHGRDVLARILYGLRVSLLFGLALTGCAALLGIFVGAIQGYYGGWVDLLGQRLVEVWNGLPMLFMVMILVSMFTPNVYWLFFIMLFFSWTVLVGIVRAEFLKARQLDYVRAAQALGVTDRAIIFKHILPNAISSSLSQLPFILTTNIIALTALDFLGYGLPPDAASLGELLLQGKNNLDAPWLALSGFFSLAFVLSLLIYIGEAARDAFDPRK